MVQIVLAKSTRFSCVNQIVKKLWDFWSHLVLTGSILLSNTSTSSHMENNQFGPTDVNRTVLGSGTVFPFQKLILKLFSTPTLFKLSYDSLLELPMINGQGRLNSDIPLRGVWCVTWFLQIWVFVCHNSWESWCQPTQYCVGDLPQSNFFMFVNWAASLSSRFS